tara:strand:- start:17 stop:586 length:570 start_codon:yes stop_codon:yes gene_type:complete
MKLERKVEYIKNNYKWPVSHEEVFFYSVITILSLILLYLCDGIIPSFYNDFTWSVLFLTLLNVGLLTGLIVLLIAEARKNRRFIVFRLEGDFSSNEKVITSAARKALKVAKISINQELGIIFIDTDRSTFSISTGERITVVKKGDNILINSRSNYMQASLYFDKRNIKRLTTEINKLNAVNTSNRCTSP